LPALVHPSTYIELFHCLLDLPLLTAALERIELEKREHGEVEGGNEKFRVLYNYVLRNESGVSINFWDSSTTLERLQEFCKVTPLTPRVVAMSELAPQLVDVFFDVLITFGDPASIHQIFPVIFQRIEQLFPIAAFQKNTQKVLVNKVLAIFNKYPDFAVTFKDLIVGAIIDGTHAERKELVLSLCWVVGEYASPTVTEKCTPQIITEYHETLETFAYERMSFAKLGLVDHPASASSSLSLSASSSSSFSLPSTLQQQQQVSITDATSGNNKTPKNDVYTTRLMLVIISALAKLAARWQDLASRVLICLAKMLREGENFHPSVAQRANECIQILKFPSIASAILDTPLGREEEEVRIHTNKNSSLPFLLMPSSYVSGMQPMHEFELLS